MRRHWVSATLLLAAATAAKAQFPSPGAEIFGGYSYARVNSGPGFNANGWEASLTGNINRFFGLEADFSQHYDTPPLTPPALNSSSVLTRTGSRSW